MRTASVVAIAVFCLSASAQAANLVCELKSLKPGSSAEILKEPIASHGAASILSRGASKYQVTAFVYDHSVTHVELLDPSSGIAARTDVFDATTHARASLVTRDETIQVDCRISE